MSDRLPLLIYLIVSASVAFAQTAPQGSELESQLAARPDNVRVREKLAGRYLKEKRHAKVIELLNPYTDVATPMALILLATAYRESNDFKELVRVFTMLADKRPNDYAVRYMLAEAQMKLAEQQTDLEQRRKGEADAIAGFRAVIRAKKNFRPAHEALVNYFIRSQANHEARESLVEMQKVFGSSGPVFSDLCRLYAVDGFLSHAVRYCLKATQLDPKRAENSVYLSQSYFDQQEVGQAEATLVSASKRFPKSEYVQYAAGFFFLQNKNYPVAQKYFQRAVEIAPQSARAHWGLAQALFENEKPAEALEHFSKACRTDSAKTNEFLSAASKLRQKGGAGLAAKYSQATGACKR